jgi:(E)-benzylidenesuccinyl-CoA hydratase
MSLIFEIHDRVAEITINRPEVMNAMDPDTYRELSEAWIRVRDDRDIWAAIITGAGDKSFTAGADLRTMGRARDGAAGPWQFWQTQSQQLLNRGLEVWKPIVAAVNGYCLGGGMTLLMATDIRIAAEHATFALSEVKRAILPANGGTQRTLRQLPYPVAMELLLTGDPIDADTAARIGLINRVVPQAKLLDSARETAARICSNGPLAVRAIKELAVRSQYMHLEEGLRLEAAVSRVLLSTDDAKEGPRAFIEKRPPVYTGQ